MPKKSEGDPENLVLTPLRKLREDVKDLKHGQKELRHAIDDLRDSMPYALGLAAQANVRSESIHKQVDELRQRVERLEGKN